MSYLDDLEDLEYDDDKTLLEAKAPQLDDEGGKNPYKSIANAPVKSPEAANPQPVSVPPPSASKPSVAQFIQQKKAPPVDPLMAQSQQEQKSLDSLREAKLGADYSGNLNQAFAQLAQGTNKPEANPVFNKIAAQNQDMIENKEKDSDRQRKVIDAIGRRDARVQIGQLTASSKNETQINRWATQMKDDLDPNKARGGNLASNQKRVDNAERIEALLSQVHSNPDPRQMEELAISAQSLLSASGTPAAEQVKALIPRSAQGDYNKMKEWLTNDPTGTGQQEFVKRLADTVQREKQVARNQVQKAQRARLSVYDKFKKASPDAYQSIYNSYGLGDDNSAPSASGGVSAETEQGASGTVRIQAPDGRIRLVPVEREQDALAAGGKRVD